MKIKRKKEPIYQSEEITTTDKETGEVTTVVNTKKRYFEKSDEPNFVKFYASHLVHFMGLPSSAGMVLGQMIEEMNYRNEVLVDRDFKKRYKESRGLSSSDNTDVVAKYLTALISKNFIKRIGKGKYFINPYIFGKGDYRDIKTLQTTYDYINKTCITKISGESESVQDLQQIEKNKENWNKIDSE